MTDNGKGRTPTMGIGGSTAPDVDHESDERRINDLPLATPEQERAADAAHLQSMRGLLQVRPLYRAERWMIKLWRKRLRIKASRCFCCSHEWHAGDDLRSITFLRIAEMQPPHRALLAALCRDCDDHPNRTSRIHATMQTTFPNGVERVSLAPGSGRVQ